MSRTHRFFGKQGQRTALILLNCDIKGPFFNDLWQASSVRICADGGANRLFDSAAHNTDTYIPDYIHGDLDSVRDDVVAYYGSKGTKVSKDPGQDNHDLEKCLELVRGLQDTGVGQGDRATLASELGSVGDLGSTGDNPTGDAFVVLVLGAFGGRLDQQMANIHAAVKWTCFQDVVLLSSDSLGVVLQPGKHQIVPDLSIESRTCGLFPISEPCAAVSTSGLRWNLQDNRLEMGSFISSSNEIEQDVVVVETSHPVLWTTSLVRD